MNGSVLVLGGGGFIGQRLCEALAQTGVPVIAATRRPETFNHELISNVVGSFDAASQFDPLLAQSRAVIHAASSSTPGSTEAQPQLDGNLRSTLSLIEALQHFSHVRLLFFSSGGTLYGDRAQPAKEDDPLRPRSYHGAGKAAAEQFIHAWTAQYEGTAITLRPSNVYGPGQLPKPGFGIIPTAFDCIIRDAPLEIWGDATVRDYLYIDDLLALCHQALEKDFVSGTHVFNATSGEGTSLKALLEAIERTAGRLLRRASKSARRVDVERIAPSNVAARDTFGWHPETSLEQGLQRTWQWFDTRR